MGCRANLLLLAVGALMSVSAPAEVREQQGVRFNGEFVQGGLVSGQVAPGSQVRLGDQAVTVSEEGTFVIGFGRDAEVKQALTVTSPRGESRQIALELKARDYDIQRIEGVPARTVNPDPEHLARIRKEASAVAQARTSASKQLAFLEGFIWPIKGPITGVYGSQRVFNGEPRRPHFGIDIAAPQGAEIVAPAAGVVTLAHPDMFFSGATMVIDHGYGINTSYLHMSKMLVKAGDPVEQGQVIGLVGASGRATGPHLCWRLNWFQTRLDPQLVVGD